MSTGQFSGTTHGNVQTIFLRIFLNLLTLPTFCEESPVHIVQGHTPSLSDEGNKPILCWTERIEKPVPVALHIMRIDLQNPAVEIVAAIAPDPDGTGPAQSALTHPLALALSNSLAAAVNANAFGGLKDKKGKEDRNWFPGQPVSLLGWVASGGRTINPPSASYWSLWVTPEKELRIGNPLSVLPATEATAGFGGLLADNRILCRPSSGGESRHPRTAGGIDGSGRYLFLMVADGRQPGYSEGMTISELATKMAKLGCANALNFDGGGSSIMIAATTNNLLRILNSPSDRGILNIPRPRPVPVLLGVRVKGFIPRLVEEP